VSAELTGKQIEKLAHKPWIAAITPDAPVKLADAAGPSAPSAVTPPAVSGTAQEGQQLTATAGTWSGDTPTLAYEWQRCGTGTRLASLLADAPAGVWRLADASGTAAADASGHAVDG